MKRFADYVFRHPFKGGALYVFTLVLVALLMVPPMSYVFGFAFNAFGAPLRWWWRYWLM